MTPVAYLRAAQPLWSLSRTWILKFSAAFPPTHFTGSSAAGKYVPNTGRVASSPRWVLSLLCCVVWAPREDSEPAAQPLLISCLILFLRNLGLALMGFVRFSVIFVMPPVGAYVLFVCFFLGGGSPPSELCRRSAYLISPKSLIMLYPSSIPLLTPVVLFVDIWSNYCPIVNTFYDLKVSLYPLVTSQ
jgi:hypothetical protein